MVEELSLTPGQSGQNNALGNRSTLCMPHQEYLRLGDPKEARKQSYRVLYTHHPASDLLADIRASIHRGMAIGQDRSIEETERLTGRRLKPKKVGRPVGWRKGG